MKKRSEVCIVVQARLQSERVPQKMIRPFANTTLLDILFTKLTQLSSLPPEQIYVSAYDGPIKEIVTKHGLQIFHRSKESAAEEKELPLIFEWYNKLPTQYKYVIMVSACNPLLTKETIDGFVESFIKSEDPGAFGVITKHTYYWDHATNPLTDWKDSPTMNTKYVDPVYEAAHCLYASELALIGRGKWMCDTLPPRLELFVMDELEAFDIDYEWQFRVGEALYKEFMRSP